MITIRDVRTKSKILEPAYKLKNVEGDNIPIMDCQDNGKPGFKYGETGKCFTFDPNSESSKAAARAKAGKQGQAIEISKSKNEAKGSDSRPVHDKGIDDRRDKMENQEEEEKRIIVRLYSKTVSNRCRIPFDEGVWALKESYGSEYDPFIVGYEFDPNIFSEDEAMAYLESIGEKDGELEKLENAFPNYHTARITDPNKYDSFATKEIDDGILAVLGIKDNKSEIQAYRFDKEKFTASEARKWLKEHDEKTLEFAAAKEENQASDLTREYLEAVYSYVREEPMIWEHVKGRIHKKARGSAGGRLKGKIPSKDQTEIDTKATLNDIGDENENVEVAQPSVDGHLMNEAKSGKILYPEFPIAMDGWKALEWLKSNNIRYVETEVIPIAEGVATGSDGIPTLKIFDEFAKDIHWLNGVPITKGHLANQGIMEVMPDTPKPGQLLDINPRSERRDGYGRSRFFTDFLDGETLDKMIKGTPLPGSIEYRARLVNEEGVWTDGTPYKRIEKSPYYFYNYALVDKGACNPPRCGVLLNEAPEIEMPNYTKIINEIFCPLNKRIDKLVKSRKQLNYGVEGMKWGAVKGDTPNERKEIGKVDRDRISSANNIKDLKVLKDELDLKSETAPTKEMREAAKQNSKLAAQKIEKLSRDKK